MSWLEKYYLDAERGKTIAEVFRGVEDRNGVEYPVYETEEVQMLVGYEMRQNLENLMEDKHDVHGDGFAYDTQMSDDILDFMENCIRLTKDPFYNLPMKPMLWQKAWIETLFSFKMYDEFLRRMVDRFTETLLLIGRKNTKSETSSALLDSMGFIGGKGMTLVAASNTYDQAKLVYDAADKMRMLLDPRGRSSHRNRYGITFKGLGNELIMMSERTKAKEGKNITIAVIDEEHEMPDNRLIKPIQQSMGVKHNRKMIKITTEGMVADGQLDKDLKDYRKIISGDRSISALRKLPWLYTQDSEKEVWETNEQGINPAWQKSNPTLIYGVKQWSYLRDNVDEARKSTADRIFVLSKDFNFKMSSVAAWLDKSLYDYDIPFDLEEFRGCTAAIGAVDLSETTDTTNAKVMLRRKDDGKKYILSHYWIPESKLSPDGSDDKQTGAKYHEWAQKGLVTICEGNENRLFLVADWFYELQKKYNIRIFKCGYDQRFKDEWIKQMEYYGWVDKEDLIMINQSARDLHTANCQIENDLRDRILVGLNEVDKWCLGNSALKVDGLGQSLIVKIDNNAARKIDGSVCLSILQETHNRCKTDMNANLQ